MALRRAPKDWSKIPAADAPDGQESNLIDPETLAPEAWAIASLMIAMSLGLVCLRVYYELRKYRKLAVENYFCLVAWVLLTGYTITGCTSKSNSLFLNSQSHYSRSPLTRAGCSVLDIPTHLGHPRQRLQ